MDADFRANFSQRGGCSAAGNGRILRGQDKSGRCAMPSCPGRFVVFQGVGATLREVQKNGARCRQMPKRPLRPDSCTSRAWCHQFLQSSRLYTQIAALWALGTVPCRLLEIRPKHSHMAPPVLSRAPTIFPMPFAHVAHPHLRWLAPYRRDSDRRAELSCSFASMFRR